ncbi:NAD-dependent epimerase/dehydratase family protein [Mumia sp. ZJ430]|uniref:NAD-dependent epimerase/dehydratase family protein n=1 Tax=Mumia sp. ZJ430 TaxID=2708083 RepID=UPI0014247B3A|nr:NAD-dependent epimerase/dehydratase family protein [Mumia sp. ZJ430]
MQDHHVIVGAGAVGREVAAQLVERGSRVTVVTRRGTAVPGATAVAADASDAAVLLTAVDGADALHNCANPSYTTWTTVWPPLAGSMLAATEKSGALLVITGNLYPYGPVDASMTEGMPDAATDPKGKVRGRMWAEALAAHQAGRVRAVEVRGSDYVGKDVGANGVLTRLVPTALRGRPVWTLGRADLPHSWTDVRDVARTQIALSDRPELAGRVWHVPSNPPRSQQEALDDVMAAAGRRSVPVRTVPDIGVRAMGRFVPMMRELAETNYQRTRPYLLDSSDAERTLGLAPTPWDEVCRRTVTN